MIRSGRRTTIKECSSEWNSSYGSRQTILTEDLCFVEGNVQNSFTYGLGYIASRQRISSSVLSIREFLTGKQVAVVFHFLHSPHLVSCDFFISENKIINIEGRRFDDIETTKTFNQLEQHKIVDLQYYFKKWQDRWGKCIASSDEYFEGD